jgi:hypothetical protein
MGYCGVNGVCPGRTGLNQASASHITGKWVMEKPLGRPDSCNIPYSLMNVIHINFSGFLVCDSGLNVTAKPRARSTLTLWMWDDRNLFNNL